MPRLNLMIIKAKRGLFEEGHLNSFQNYGK